MEDSGIDSDPRIGPALCGVVEAFAPDSESSQSSYCGNDFPVARDIQRRLEKKLEVKKVRTTQCEYRKVNTAPNTSMIPIQRLPIPSKMAVTKEQLPLVEWDTDDSEEEVHFFPMNKGNVKAELTDTFSIEEMPISAEEDDLHLLPPKDNTSKYFCCPWSLRCTLL